MHNNNNKHYYLTFSLQQPLILTTIINDHLFIIIVIKINNIVMETGPAPALAINITIASMNRLVNNYETGIEPA